MSNELTDWTRDLLDAPTYAVRGTVNPDGSPQLTTVWITREGHELLISTTDGRQKPRNVRRDDRVSVMLVNPENPFQCSEVRGRGVVVPDETPDGLINVLSREYTGNDWTADGPDTVRVIIRITPTKVIEHR